MAIPDEVMTLADNRAILDRIARVFQNAGSGLTPFVGAGLSRPYGFPLWRDFLLDVAAQAEAGDLVDRVERRLDAGEYEEAAEDLENALSADRFQLLFDSSFGETPLEQADLTTGAATIIPAMALGPVITTNFDNVLERLFSRAQRPFEDILWGARINPSFTRFAHEGRRILIKLHGDVDDKHDRVLTLSEYRRHYGSTDDGTFDREAPLPTFLLSLITARPALFIGCSLNKDRTVSVVCELARTLRESDILHYAILEAPPTREELLAKHDELLGRKIGTVWFPPGGFSVIETILQHIAASIPAGRRPVVAARSTASVPTNLRYPAKAFVGREKLVGNVTELMRRDRFATLLGPPGSGKTQVAVEVGRELLSHFRDGVFFVSLSDLSEGEEIPGHIADAIDSQEQAEKPPLNALVAKLRNHHCLLILDRCEHLVDDVGDVITELLDRTVCVAVLATSRELLRRAGETQRRVGPMSVPPEAESTTLAELEKHEATRLFLTRIDDTARREGLTDHDAPLVAEICRELDGIPLAIELAAGLTRRDSLAAVHRGLGNRFSYLRSRLRDSSPRHTTLTAAVAWSYEPLPPELKRLLLAVSVFQGGWDEDAALAVSSEDDGDPDRLRHELWELFDRSLVERASEDGRYSLLGTLREYAFAHLERVGESEQAILRHARFFVQLVEKGAPRLVLNAEKPGWITRLDRENANVRGAIRRTCERGDFEIALRLAAAYWRVWELRGHLSEGRRMLGDLLRAVGTVGHERHRARVLSGLSILAYRQGDMEGAFRDAQAAYDLEVALDPPNPARVAECLNDIGIATQQLGRLGEASEAYAKSGELFGQLVEDLRSAAEVDRGALASAVRQEAIARYNSGNMEYMRGALERARDVLSRAAEDFERIGMETELGFPLTALARTLTELGALAEAETYLEKALKVRRRLDLKGGQADSLHALGRLNLAKGELDEAVTYLAEALRIQRDIDDRKGIALSLESMGLVAIANDDVERAAALFAVASRLLAELHLPVRPVDRDALEAGHEVARRAGHDPSGGSSALNVDDAVALALSESPDKPSTVATR